MSAPVSPLASPGFFDSGFAIPFRLQSGLSLLSYNRERSGVRESDLSENLTVKLNLRFCESLNELAVGESVQASCRVDTNDPETTEITLFSPTIAVRELQSFLDCSLSKLETSVTTTTKSFR
jgi:hypothetical protein